MLRSAILEMWSRTRPPGYCVILRSELLGASAVKSLETSVHFHARSRQNSPVSALKHSFRPQSVGHASSMRRKGSRKMSGGSRPVAVNVCMMSSQRMTPCSSRNSV